MSDPSIKFPKPFRENGRLYWLRSELERYKRAVISAQLGAPAKEEVQEVIEEFVPASQIVKEFGFGRRTLGRRIADSAANAEAHDPA